MTGSNSISAMIDNILGAIRVGELGSGTADLYTATGDLKVGLPVAPPPCPARRRACHRLWAQAGPKALPFMAIELAANAVEFDAFGEHWRCRLDSYACERAEFTPSSVRRTPEPVLAGDAYPAANARKRRSPLPRFRRRGHLYLYRCGGQYALPMLRLKPLAWWVIPWGLLAGIILTLLCLGSMTWEPLADCGQTTSPPYSLYSPPGGCSTIVEGYPVRFLSSEPLLEQNPGTSFHEAGVSGVPVINKGGLVEDWFIWSVVSCLALYIVSARRLYILSARKTEGEQGQTRDPVASA